MKRKCNLFYTAGEDTNFITFSNYTESLTGSFLATDMKIFPTKFICAYVEGLNNSNREKFIKDIARYYENKLAFLRDYFIETNKDWQNNISPLYDLLNFICQYDFANNYYENIGLYTNANIKDSNSHFSPTHNYISYIGEITEQDYNGTYADNICVISTEDKAQYYDFPTDKEEEICNPWKTYKFNLPSDYKYTNEYLTNYQNYEIEYTSSPNYLYSWYGVENVNEEDTIEKYIGPKNYEEAKPIFDKKDDDKCYYYNVPKYSVLVKLTEDMIANRLNGEKNIYSNNIKFNIIIPLYDLVNINYMNNKNVINEDENPEGHIYLIPTESNENNNFISNIPLGIWFSGNEPIELKRDSSTGYAPSWSLVLSSQFKPFPYSKTIHTEITNGVKLDAYQTYAQILSKQNGMIDEVHTMFNRVNDIEKRLENFEGKFNTVGSAYSLDGLHEELHDMKNDIQDQINSIISNLESITNLLWKYKQ